MRGKTRACLALALSAMLVLSGCAAMLEQTYVRVERSEDQLSVGEGSSAAEVSSRAELTTAVLNLVRQGVEQGTVRLMDYRGDVESDLAGACLEVAQEDPLGAYAVESIKYDYVRVISHYEANIYITYRRTQEQVAAIAKVIGSSAIRTELRAALAEFRGEVVLQISYFNEDEEYIRELARQAYYETPVAALGEPGIAVTLYPDQATGYRRIVEIRLAYSRPADELRRLSVELATAAETLTGALTAYSEGDESLRAAYNALRGTATYIPALSENQGEAANTAWHALVAGEADSEGMALAFALLCQRQGRECMVVRGTLDGLPHFWNIIRLENGEYRHVDASRADGFALSDAQLLSQGYAWDREDSNIPLCGEQPAVQTEEQTETDVFVENKN